MKKIVIALTAEADLSSCPQGHMCVWGNVNFQWEIADRDAGNSNWVDPFTDAEENEDESWANRSARYVGCIAGGPNGGGVTHIRMPEVTRQDNIHWANDKSAESMRTKGDC